MTRSRWDYSIKCFAGPKHMRGAPFGKLLKETVHKGKHSRDVETWAWLSLMTKNPGAYDRIQVIAHCEEVWEKTIHEYEALSYLNKDRSWLRPGTFADVEKP